MILLLDFHHCLCPSPPRLARAREHALSPNRQDRLEVGAAPRRNRYQSHRSSPQACISFVKSLCRDERSSPFVPLVLYLFFPPSFETLYKCVVAASVTSIAASSLRLISVNFLCVIPTTSPTLTRYPSIDSLLSSDFVHKSLVSLSYLRWWMSTYLYLII